MRQNNKTLPDLYETDEVAWLETTAQLIAAGRHTDLDYLHLQEYLTDMANRDRREVVSRLRFFLAHLLKWTHQPEERTGKWAATILRLQFDLENILESRALRDHAETELAEAYEDAVGEIAMEIGEFESQFPKNCPWTVDMLMADELLEQ
jgi:hypothetical protein